jgi:hypothetical protein
MNNTINDAAGLIQYLKKTTQHMDYRFKIDNEHTYCNGWERLIEEYAKLYEWCDVMSLVEYLKEHEE